MNTWILSRLSTEWVGPITASADGDLVTAWTYTLALASDPPDTVDDIAATPQELDGGLGILVGPGTDHVLEPGAYRIWIRYADSPEAPVLNDVGTIYIT